MSDDSLCFSIMAQELDELRRRIEQLEQAMKELEGRYVITLPIEDGEWTITPMPKWEG